MKKSIFSPISIIAAILLCLTCACETVVREVYIYDPGTLNAFADSEHIESGQYITYIDSSTKVHLRDWIFEGGEPYTSSESEVTVFYKYGGDFTTSLDITYVDNLKDVLEIPIFVDGPAKVVNPQPEFSESYAIYTEYTEVTLGNEIYFEPNNGFTFETVTDNTYEGDEATRLTFDASQSWAMVSVISNDGPADISYFMDGSYNIALRSTSQDNLLLRLQGGGEKAILTLEAATETYGFARDGQWYLLEIPMADFIAANPAVDLTKITSFVVFRSDEGNGNPITDATDYDFYFDNIFLSK